MWRSLTFFVFYSFLVQVSVGQSNDIKPKEKVIVKEQETKKIGDETLTVSVKMTENEEGSNGLTEIQVNFKVTIENDIVKVNGKLTELDIVTSYEIEAEIVEHSNIMRTALVEVHVLVVRKNFDNGYKFFLEEEVVFIDKKTVDQVDVRLLTIHMNTNGKEYKRTIEKVTFEESHIKRKPVQKFCRKGDLAPKMDEPELPDESGIGKTDHDHRHNKKWGKGFCSRFHKLPFAARVAILVGIIFVLVCSVMCCACFCCRKAKKSYNLHLHEEKPDFELEEEAEPLPEKLAFDDKQVLLA